MLRRILVLLALALGSATLAPRSAQAQQAASSAQSAINLSVGEGRLVRLDRDATNVFVADSAVADVQIVSPRTIYIYGRKIGSTTVTAAAAGDSVAGSIGVRVVRSAAAAQEALPRSRIAGGGPISLSFAGDRLVVSGTVSGGVGEAQDTAAAAEGYNSPGRPPLDRTQFVGTRQITLRVRIAEVSRTALNQLGINWDVAIKGGSFTFSLLTGGFLSGQGNIFSGLNLGQTFGVAGASVASRSGSGNALINALQREQVLSLLAEPNLTTISGRTARFLAGGQVPIPVPQSFGVTTIEYKPYGVSLAFTPTLLPGNRIALDVHPEVSEIDSANGVTINSTAVPAFTSRSAETTVEMASGQTVAIAGLFMRSVTTQLDRYPFLADIPILGALFRSQSYQRGDTELVILITPYLTDPVSAPDAFPLPTDNVSQVGNRVGRTGGFAVE